MADCPLEAFADPASFKIYLADTGLLVSKAGAQRADILSGLGSTFSGAVAKSFVAQQLSSRRYVLHYWSGDNRSGIDFAAERQGCLSAIKVKSGENTRARSLSSLKGKRGINRLVRLSAKPFGKAGAIFSAPLYAAHCL